MSELLNWKYGKMMDKTLELMSSLGYECHGVANRAEAKEKVISLVNREGTIGFGGSTTMNELGVVDYLRDNGYNILDRFKAPNHQEDIKLRRRALHADFFLSGVNAITKKGQLCFVDSMGNRPAAVLFGPDTVIIAAGLNKITDDLDTAMKRIYSIAPANAMRNRHNNLPCVQTGECEGQCYRQDCLCNSFTVIQHCLKYPGRIKLVLVAEQLGL